MQPFTSDGGASRGIGKDAASRESVRERDRHVDDAPRGAMMAEVRAIVSYANDATALLPRCAMLRACASLHASINAYMAREHGISRDTRAMLCAGADLRAQVCFTRSRERSAGALF